MTQERKNQIIEKAQAVAYGLTDGELTVYEAERDLKAADLNREERNLYSRVLTYSISQER